MSKFSRQRECILMNLKSRCDHPTADMVYDSVREEYPNISLGTVYRNLTFLAENGEILKLTNGNGAVHFDGCTKPHNHIICKTCGEIFDMDFVSDEKIIEEAASCFDGEVTEVELQFFGKCSNCLSNNK